MSLNFSSPGPKCLFQKAFQKYICGKVPASQGLRVVSPAEEQKNGKMKHKLLILSEIQKCLLECAICCFLFVSQVFDKSKRCFPHTFPQFL